MAISFKRYFIEIRPHILYDVSKYVLVAAVSLLVGAGVFLYRFLRGYPRDLLLIGAISIGAFLLMTLAFFIARYARKTENEKLREANSALLRQNEELEARVADHQDKPPTQTIDATSIVSCGESHLHQIANEDRLSIDHLVTITVIDSAAK